MAIVLISISANTAKAQGGFGWYGYPTVYPAVYPTIYPTTVGYGGIYHGDVWHDTSHVHYHAPKIILHGNHVHFVPGRRVVHRTGHWDHLHW
jgi:hypothetical protein